METKHLAAIAAALSAVESGLVLSSIIPPLASYSPITILFLLSRLVAVGWAGWLCAESGLKRAARSGAMVAASAMAVIVAAVAIGRSLGVPVLGIQAQDLMSLVIIIALTFAMNVLLGALVAVVAAFIRRTLAPKEVAGKKG
jgi:hypothetical protein